jgi:hypothetical protein
VATPADEQESTGRRGDGEISSFERATETVRPASGVESGIFTGSQKDRRRELGVRAAASGLVRPCAPNGAASHQTFCSSALLTFL